MPGFLPRVRSRLNLFLPALVFLGLLLLVPTALTVIPRHTPDRFAAMVMEAGREAMGAGYLAAVLVPLAITLYITARRGISREKGLLTTAFALLLLVNLYLLPLGARVLQEPVREAALLARGHGYDVVMWKINVYSFLVYTEKTVERRTPRPGDVVLTRADKLDLIREYDLLFQKNGVVMVRVTAMD